MIRSAIVFHVLALPAAANAGGFYVPEIGARATAMGAAVVALPTDPAAVFHNPAGLAGQDAAAAAGLNLFLPRIEFFRAPVDDPSTGERVFFEGAQNENAVLPAPWLGGVLPVGRRLALGLAVYAPFGAAIEYPQDGSQRHVVRSVDLRVIHASPAVAWRVADALSIGLAAHYVHGSLALHQANAVAHVTGDPEAFPDPEPGMEGTNRLEASDPFSVGATVGVLVRPSKRIAIGASVMSPVTLALEGDAVIANPAITVLRDEDGNEVQPAGRRTDSFSSEIPLPLVARLGVAVRPVDSVAIEADVNWQRWSTFEELVVDFENEWELLPTPGAYLYDVTAENDWSDTFTARLGADLSPRGAPWRARVGALWDPSPMDDAHFDVLAPDSDKVGLGAGAGYTLGIGGGRRLDVDLSYLHLLLAERVVRESRRTILNKPAPSFYRGTTRASFGAVGVQVGIRFE
jgi:long-chain fatty acid transport protein